METVWAWKDPAHHWFPPTVPSLGVECITTKQGKTDIYLYQMSHRHLLIKAWKCSECGKLELSRNSCQQQSYFAGFRFYDDRNGVFVVWGTLRATLWWPHYLFKAKVQLHSVYLFVSRCFIGGITFEKDSGLKLHSFPKDGGNVVYYSSSQTS